jgi:hypothetical protein
MIAPGAVVDDEAPVFGRVPALGENTARLKKEFSSAQAVA